MGREMETSDLLKCLADDNLERIVNVVGLRGIGKSSLVKNTLHYVSDRKMFTGGIFHIQLKNSKTCIAMLKMIMREILRQISLDKET